MLRCSISIMIASPSQMIFRKQKTEAGRLVVFRPLRIRLCMENQPLLEANTRRVVFSSTTNHAHAAGHVHHHSHHHVVRLSKLHNTTRLLSFKITVSCGNERSITQFPALVNPKIHKSGMKYVLEKINASILKFDRLRCYIGIVAAQRRHARAVAAHAADPVERFSGAHAVFADAGHRALRP